MVVVKTVVGNQQHRRLGSRHLQQPPEHHVVKTINASDHVAVGFGILHANVAHRGWVVLDEAVAGMIDGVEVHGQKIPVLARREASGRVLHRGGFREQTRQHARTRIRRVGGQPVREKGQQLLERDLVQADAEAGRGFQQVRRMHGARVQRWIGSIGPQHVNKAIGEHLALNGFGGMGRKPVDHAAAKSVLAQNVPQRLRLARSAADRASAQPVGGWLGKPEDTMFIGAFAGGDGVPQDGRDDRVQSGDPAAGAAFDQTLEHGHLAPVHEGMDDLPVRRVPAEQQDAFGMSLGHQESREKIKNPGVLSL